MVQPPPPAKRRVRWRWAAHALLLFGISLALPGLAVAQVCSYGVTGLNFGSIDTLAGTAATGTATASINCSTSVLTASICPSIGYGSGGGSGTMRQLLGPGGSVLTYGLYYDAAHTQPIGSLYDPSLGQVTPWVLTGGLLTPIRETRTIYGRIDGGQRTAVPGVYQSTQIAIFDAALLSLLNCRLSLLTSQGTAGFSINAQVPSTCLVSASDLDFGRSGVLRAAIDAASMLQVTCTPGTTYSVSLDGGLSGATDPTARLMRSGSRTVRYGLYQNAARSVPWGSAPAQRLSGQGSGVPQSIPVHGRVPAQNTPPAGTYSDRIIVTITYGT